MTFYDIIKNTIGKIIGAGMIGFSLVLGGCSIFGGEDNVLDIKAAEEVYQIGVNAYLWRATLDTLSFLPLRSADQTGGVILTEWAVNPDNSQEQTKVDVIILGKKLDAISLKVTVHRQRMEGGQWQTVEPRPGAEVTIRNAILMQARLLRRNNAPIR